MEAEISIVRDVYDKLTENIRKVIKGKDETVRKVMIALLTGGHVLLEDVPGSGKTMLAKTLAASVSGDFKRIQMTPDLLPADLTGVHIFDPKTSEFRFVQGPVFTNILIADEINRATPKTQAGLLECMEEGQVTMDGETYTLDKPFLVIATENPVDTQGVFPLPEAQIDRFLMKLYMEYPNHENMIDIFRTHVDKGVIKRLNPVVTLDEICHAMRLVETVSMEESVIEYVVDIVEATRKKEQVALGVSQRGGLALLRASKTVAALQGRTYVIPDDVRDIAGDVLAHRLILKNSMFTEKNRSKALIQEILEQIPVPTEEMNG